MMIETTVGGLQAGDVLCHPDAEKDLPHYTVVGIQRIGPVAIVDFADRTATAPIPVNATVLVMRRTE
jgi:hypothetical protein